MTGIINAVAKKEISFVYLLGVDEIDMSYFGEAFVVYQGHHGDIGAHRADVVLPGAAYTEKNGTYVNTEGRVQHALQAVFPPGQAKEDWQVVAKFAEVLGKKLPYQNHAQLRSALETEFPTFAQRDVIQPAAFVAPASPYSATKIAATPFDYPVMNFYMTDPISRASKTMAQCVEQILHPSDEKKVA